jgi:hypothetical protein
MIDINWNPTRRELRQFSIALIVAAGVVGGLLWWKLGPNRISTALWVAGPTLGVLGLIVPTVMRPVFIGLSLVAFPIGYVVGFLALALVYYLLVTPIGLVFRLMGRDPMHRRFDRSAPTYWIQRPEAPPARRYFQQF